MSDGIRIRAFERRDTDAVVALWEDAGLTRPWNDPRADIERKLAVQPELFLVAEEPAPVGAGRAQQRRNRTRRRRMPRASSDR